MDMKPSQYARRAGVTYKTGMLDAYQTPTGTIVVREGKNLTPTAGRIALYARVSEASQKEDLERQLQRLKDYAAAKGYTVSKEVVEIASGLNDSRPKLTKLLSDPTIGTIIVERKDRLTRFGFEYIRQLLEVQNRGIELLFETETKDELVDDFVAVITSMAARLYGRRHAEQRALCIKECLEKCLEMSI
jgi:putative resolvase